ncbi:AgmX/PglI C-terminal domain-containing protein, partial [bacterium]|nr:AgmX/PglI C-terminal domain-containing protein [bacterium]
VIVASVAPPAMPAASNQPSAVSDQPTVPVPPPAAPEPPAVAPVPVAEPEEASDDDSPGVTAIAAVPEDKGEQLTDQQIKGVIASRVKIFTHCFFMGVRENPKMSGYAMMNFTINPNGSVGAAYLKSSSLASPVAEDCLVARMKRVQFPSFNGKPQDVSFPFKYIQ